MGEISASEPAARSGSPGWEFWVDVGGTFTDCLGRSPDGRVTTHKLLSTGVYKATVAGVVSGTRLRVGLPERAPDRFFQGWRIRSRRTVPEGRPPVETAVEVASFDAETGEIELADARTGVFQPGEAVELVGDIEAPVAGIRWILGLPPEEPVGKIAVRLGTTRGTNALLERKGARTALVTNDGFEDVLAIAYQNRPRLFDLRARKAAPLCERSVGVAGRIAADGAELQPVDPAALRRCFTSLRDEGIQSVAVCMLHSHKNPAHEREAAAIAREVGFRRVSVSSEIAPLQRIVPRGDTAVVDAYLTPVIGDYVGRLREQMPEADIRVMTSAGGLVRAERFIGKDSIYSGPAGGVAGVAAAAAAAGFPRAIGFDMGGTSTDVCRCEGKPEIRHEMELCAPGDEAGVRVVAPMLDIETVASGGGSVCWFDGVRLRVGPHSAGADPGPACYGRGGPLTVTDANLVLGRILPAFFPFPLDEKAVSKRLEETAESVRQSTGHLATPDELAAGFIAVADQTMAAPIRKVSLEKGYDPREHALVSFGGAGGQHACRVADELGIRAILQHPHASFLSAYGIGMAQTHLHRARDVGRPLDDGALSAMETLFSTMEAELKDEMAGEGVPPEWTGQPQRAIDIRYAGQDAVVPVPAPPDGDYPRAFADAHRRLYGFDLGGRAMEARTARVELSSRRPAPSEPAVLPPADGPPKADAETRVRMAGGWAIAPVYKRSSLMPGHRFDGPAVVVEGSTTVVVEPGWAGRVARNLDLVLERGGDSAPARPSGIADQTCDPVQLALFHSRFTQVADAMGVTLRKTALSVNVKERLDFSCAVFDGRGSLVVNAPHIPVHLGAMGATVRAIAGQFRSRMEPGDVYVTNDPFLGGSHLPDVTVVMPVFDDDGGEIRFFLGSRAHHAEIGGITPGSMPPFARKLSEEGVRIPPFRFVRGGVADEDGLRRTLSGGPHPSRAVGDNVADVRAQAAAAATGRRRLHEMVDRYGWRTVDAYMGHMLDAAERMTRRALSKFQPGVHRFSDAMDDGSPICVAVTVRHAPGGGEAVLDFTGSAPVSEGNLNANPAIVRSAALYVFRCAVGEDVPLNDGFLRPVTLIIPRASILDPEGGYDPSDPPAVVAGNVETSQRVVDVLLGALNVAAASQGTMNNLLFGRPATGGRKGFGYYETICGGGGAGPGWDGGSAVHTHMTNTRITDPEVLEDRFPVRLVRFQIRRGSGGVGANRGGDGVVRELEFLEPMTVSLVSGRRVSAPFGMEGGSPGSPGKNSLLRKGEVDPIDLGPMAAVDAGPGDRLLVETPGGGGWGDPRQAPM